MPLHHLAARLPDALRPALYISYVVSLGVVAIPVMAAPVLAILLSVNLFTMLSHSVDYAARTALGLGFPAILAGVVYGLMRSVSAYPFLLRVILTGASSGFTFGILMVIIIDLERGRSWNYSMWSDDLSAIFALYTIIFCVLAWVDIRDRMNSTPN